MDGWMGGWVDVQHTLALESYKHNNNYFFLIDGGFHFLFFLFLYLLICFNVFSW